MPGFHLYRPQRTDPDLLEKITVGREPLLQEILERLARWKPGTSRQHDLFIGPRGIGKTHLLRLVEHRVRTESLVREKWVPLCMAEEFYSASRVSDFLLEALRLLAEEPAAEKWAGVYDDVRYDDDDDRVLDRCLDAFRGFHRETGRGVLLMLENLDRLLDRQVKRKTEAHKLRRILIEEDWLVVLCTSPTYLNAISEPKEPFFEFFRVHSLAEMTPEEQEEMMHRLADSEQDPELDGYLKMFRSRLRALYHFTGGNPRLAVMLYGLVAHFEVNSVRSELDLLLDQLTPFYQDRMKEISEQEAKILERMSLLPEGATPTELARETRIDAKVVRATMTRLERAGYVRREARRQKRTVYIVPERLFRIWHQMNHSRAARGRAQHLLEFFASWYATRKERDLVWEALGRLGSVQAVEPLIRVLGDLDPAIRGAAAISLGRFSEDLTISQLGQVITAFRDSTKALPRSQFFMVVRLFLRTVFEADDVSNIDTVLGMIREASIPKRVLRPYELALEYLESDRDPTVLERQHPEMREAVLLLVNRSPSNRKGKADD